MIQCNDLALEYNNSFLFKDVNINLLKSNRYAIVGANGTGKTSFLKMISGEVSSSIGSISIPKNIRVGILKQDHFRYKDQCVIDVVIDGKPELANAIKRKNDILSKETITEKDCFDLAELEEIILTLDGYSAESQAQKILTGLGVAESYHKGPLNALSGGFKLRVLLAQALFQNPDVLLLDEPTNHLDIASISWLENFLLNEYQGLLIFVTHDRELINNLATHILDVDYKTITIYNGSYEGFINKKSEILMQKEHELAHKQQRIAEMQEYADKFRAKPSRAKQALSRLKMIDRIELPEIKDSSRIKPNFYFTCDSNSGKQVLEIKKLGKSFNDKKLFKNINLLVSRGQKNAIVGPNGVGKTTFIKSILGHIDGYEGDVSWNEKVKIGYFPQNFHELLIPELTLLEWLMDDVSELTELQARKILGHMLFSGDDVEKKIKNLSGGESARLLFGKLIALQPNVLILDEPTNHLDLETIDALAEGIKAYSGTVICISHNRFFVQSIASSLIVITDKFVDCYNGSYQDYVNKMGKDYLLISQSRQKI